MIIKGTGSVLQAEDIFLSFFFWFCVFMHVKRRKNTRSQHAHSDIDLLNKLLHILHQSLLLVICLKYTIICNICNYKRIINYCLKKHFVTASQTTSPGYLNWWSWQLSAKALVSWILLSWVLSVQGTVSIFALNSFIQKIVYIIQLTMPLCLHIRTLWYKFKILQIHA